MNLSSLENLIKELGVKRCAEEFSALVDLAEQTNDPLVLVQNPIYEAMLHDKARNTSKQAETISPADAT